MTEPQLRHPFPPPRHEVRVQPDVMVPMRDGVHLATDVYLPEGRGGPLPTIMIRTQYGKDQYRLLDDPWTVEAWQFAGQGFAVVAQDLRGLFGSEGDYRLAGHDGPDGYDTLSWVVGQPWSNGRVGTLGCSSLGITQVLLAQLRHPAHTCAVAQASGGANGGAGGMHTYWDVWRGGALDFGWALEWFAESGNKDRSAPAAPEAADVDRVIRGLPVIAMARELGAAHTDWEDWVSHPPGDPWWRQFGFLRDDSAVDVPTLFVNSWYDIGAADAVVQRETFARNAISAPARRHQHLILSPARHCGSERLRRPTKVGDRELGDASFDFWGLYLQWFGHFLDDRPSRAIEELPPFQYFTMGTGRWQAAPTWPPPGVEIERWHLDSDGGARTRLGDGVLHRNPPTGATSDRFVYDPGDPMPSIGGGSGGPYAQTGPRDHADLELRDDVLVYSTPPLEAPVEVSGTVRAVLHVSCSTPDTDLVVKVLDVDPEGRSFDIVDGILRLRYRDGFDRAVAMRPGEVYRVAMDLDATSNTFLAGHRIRVQVTASNFPRYDRNLNTGGDNHRETRWQTADVEVHHSAEHPSHVLLPIQR